ncbi:sensor histidine kinase [Xanthobacter sp. TB0139]|uniref:sensor histidine kinase n=1 Tax=Xanthobacter sp. TB0139 TaxID=3459178 RepID=UPI0040395AEA
MMPPPSFQPVPHIQMHHSRLSHALHALRSRWGLLAFVFLICTTLVLTLGRDHLTRAALEETAVRGENTLRLAVSGLRGELAQFERLPRFLAQQDILADAVRPGASEQVLSTANHYLQEVNALLGSSDLYVIRPDGHTVAASNYDLSTSFIGHNFTYRPYFTDALAGGEGRFFALGTTSRKRGFYFGAPILRQGRTLGVLVLKMDIDALEDSWRTAEYEIIVTDPEGIIFMASRQAWQFKTLAPLTDEMRARVSATRRYDMNPLPALPLTQDGIFESSPLLRLKLPQGSREFMMVSEAMPSAGWTVSMLMDTASAHTLARTGTLAALLAVALTTLGLAIVLQRRARLHERMEMQREAQMQLEKRVDERTQELAGLNTRLQAEVAERRATEMELRRTQSRLVQSGKLMALGQMSAALSHEFNQPLGALRNFADNALAYIDRGRFPEARDNISRILNLADRMKDISRTLRNFARKADQKLCTVTVQTVWAEALEVIAWRLRGTQVQIEDELGPVPLHVKADAVRLQQVLVNLVSNAIDVLGAHVAGRVRISAETRDGKVILRVADNGPGVPPGMRERIFDPFFTSKGVGRGLGLGLSISYNIIKDFGGELRVTETPGGGAMFEMELTQATQETRPEPEQDLPHKEDAP